MANTSASVMPAVAMATVRQVSRATSSRNSGLYTNGQKLAINFALILMLPGSNKTQGLNSVVTPNGHSATNARLIQKTRDIHAGSRSGAAVDAE